MFFTFPIGFQTSLLIQGEMIDLLAFFSFFVTHPRNLKKKKKQFLYSDHFSVTQIEMTIYLSDLSEEHLNNKNGQKRIKTESWVFHGGTQIYPRF